MDDKTNIILEEIYKTNPFNKRYRSNFKAFKNKKHGVYGEMTFESVESVVNYFPKYFTKDTVFYDLGSGLGKMVMHIGMKYKVKKSIGIELCKKRHEGAVELQDLFCENNPNIEFYNTSFLEWDLSDANVIYIDNMMYDEDMGNKIISKIPKGCLVTYSKAKSPFPREKKIKIGQRSYGYSALYYFIK